MKARKPLSVLIALALAAGLAACSSGGGATTSGGDATTGQGETGGAGEAVVWKFGHTRPQGTENDILANDFADQVTTALEGRVEIQMYPNNELGDYTVVQEAVGLGEVQLFLGSVSNGVDKTMSVGIVPYLATSWEEAIELYNSETGIITNYMAERFEAQNIKLLAIIPKYFGAVATSKEPGNIKDPTGDKGLKIRVPQMKSFENFAASVGFQTTPLPNTEVFTSVQTGIIDGTCGGGAESYYSEFREVMNYIIPMKTHFEPHWIYINMDAWNNLSAEDQAAITAIAQQVEEQAFIDAQENEHTYLELFEDAGKTIIDFSDEEIGDYADYVRTNVWPEIKDEYGDQVWSQIEAYFGL